MAETHLGLFGHLLYADAPPDVADEDTTIAAQPSVGGVVDGRDDIRFERVFANDFHFNMLRCACYIVVRCISRAFLFASAKAKDV